MESSYYTNTLHVKFESVLAMDDPGMVSMFQALMASGLEGFLGCPTVIYEDALVDFFENASVRDGVVVSTVHGVTMEIFEQLFAETFELPLEGLSELSEIPKDLVFDARSIVSLSGEPVSMSGKKKEMKFEYRLLCDIMEKTLSVKAGSFNAITMEKFLMLTAIVCGVRINWTSILFNILKKMVTPGSKQAKGYAVQISLLLENVPNLELGESSEFPSSKILTDKTVHRYIVLNEKVGAEGAADAPKVTRAPKKKAASKKRPAAVPVAEPVVKKKRTTKKKSGSLTDNVEMVAVALEAVPIQIIEPIPVAAAEETIVEDSREAPSAVPDDEDISAEEKPAVEVAAATGEQEPAVEHMDEQIAEPTADEETVVENTTEPAVEPIPEEAIPTSVDDVDNIIEQVLAEIAHIEANEEDHGVGTSNVGDQLAGTADDSVPWFDLPYEVLIDHDSEQVFETASDTEDEEMETIDVGDQQLQIVDAAVSRADAAADYFVEESVEETETEAGELSADEAKSVEDILMTVPVDVPLPSAGVEITKITLVQSIKIPGVDERTWYLASLPKIKPDEKGKKPVQEKDPVKGHPVKEQIFVRVDAQLANLWRALSVIPRGSWGDVSRRFTMIRWADDATPNQPSLPTVATNLSAFIDNLRTSLSERLARPSDALLQQGEDLRKLIQNVRQDGRTLDDVQTLRFNDFMKDFLAHSAAVTADSMDFRKEFGALNAKVTSLDEKVAATRNDLLEFRQFRSSRPQPPPDDQNRGSGNTGGDNVRTTDIVDRFSGSMSREGRGRGRSGGNRSGYSKRRRYDSGGTFWRSFEDWLG
ncbi:hypothetical protein F511_10038 [Dorcoceras hygrometricum]|uniref:Dystroglycan-like n=1 Tax=Dorcoceras hygrometricum TaxID=472368 RepID=A0A2Z7ADM9_9LAMI|nr:hypothetical protein F511_10038 [Dorcoceras hygrometricum]